MSTVVQVSSVDLQVAEQLDTAVLGWQLPACCQHCLRLHSTDTCIVWHMQSSHTSVMECLLFVVTVVAGPKKWNGLSAQPRQPDIELRQFKRVLETFLFCGCGVSFWTPCLTYLSHILSESLYVTNRTLGPSQTDVVRPIRWNDYWR